MFRNLGPTELILILLIIVLLFGASKLPQLGRGIGEGLREFKKAVKDSGSEEDRGDANKS